MAEVGLDDYAPMVGEEEIEELRLLARALEGTRLLHVNSTALGGGVAEILRRLVPLLNEVGLEARWEVMEGDEPFYQVTKAFHNALQGKSQEIQPQAYEIYQHYTRLNLERLALEGDCVIIHDPQPAGLIERRAGARWVWRCHIDLSAPQRDVWEFLRGYVERYDAAIFSLPAFARRLSIHQFLIAPSIDPLSDKNRELSALEIARLLDRLGIDGDRPILTQVSRFDRLKDPLGVISAYRLVKLRQPEIQLVLAGGAARDDPEGEATYREVLEAAQGDPDIHILNLPPDSHLEINALQRASTIVLQKSLREGFGLTVTEALWKGRAVIGSAAGGIRQQILPNITGMLVHSVEGTAYRIRQLLGDPDLRERLGRNGREHVRRNFLITRHLKDYLVLLLALRDVEESILELS